MSLRFFALLFLVAHTGWVCGAQQNITITNHTGEDIDLVWYRPDPGFSGPHVIVRDRQRLPAGLALLVSVTTRNIGGPRCLYWLPDDDTAYSILPYVYRPEDPTLIEIDHPMPQAEPLE